MAIKSIEPKSHRLGKRRTHNSMHSIATVAARAGVATVAARRPLRPRVRRPQPGRGMTSEQSRSPGRAAGSIGETVRRGPKNEGGKNSTPSRLTESITKKERKPRMSRSEKSARASHQNAVRVQTPTIPCKSHQIEGLMESARQCHSTDAVTILENNSSDALSSHPDKHFKIKVITSCANSPLPGHDADAITSTIHVKPLLVLDMNGIMCHRIRIHKECPSVVPNKPKMFFRPVIGFIASTNIVPRPNLESFLEYLATHFCLAVWTSARAKNARLLIKAIFPESISKRLLFVWAQSECKTVYNKDNPEDPIFVKDLEKVWKKYPLWNSNNTLLVDDSPEKCLMWQANAIHPPPLNGLKNPITGKIRDEINVAHQQRFFEHLVIHWTNNSLVHDWDSESGDAVITNGVINQFDFLRRNGVGHMGYSA